MQYKLISLNIDIRPRVIFSSTNNFQSLIGYDSGTHPSSLQTSSYNTIGTTILDLCPAIFLVAACNIVNNFVISPTNILAIITIISNTSFGNNINYTSLHKKWISVSHGKQNEFVLSFLDQNFDIIEATDNHVSIYSLLKQLEDIPSYPLCRPNHNLNSLRMDDNDDNNISN